jgi:putative protease
MAIGKAEVLAPAGSAEGLCAAVRAGADAVYLGASRFSARAGAKNFGPQELREAVTYCHARGVKVYLAVNTLVLDDEIDSAIALLREACSLPVDAVLVQDMGLVRLLRRCAPELRLHASTQTGVHTVAGAKALFTAGFRRVVLARELSLRETEEIHCECPIELESFVHGALCMSVSGQCYFSSVLGSRSGNRGMCAQPCRLPFSVPGGTGHDLSLRDLTLIDRIDEVENAGVVSLKIEGRLKRPEYVAAATHACRLAADGQPVPAELTEQLSAVFSRSGFTQGYADGQRGIKMFGIRSKDDVKSASESVLRPLRDLYSSELQRIPVDFTLKIPYNKPMSLTASDGEAHTVCVTGNVPEKARSVAADAEHCEKQLKKTGGTPFFVRTVTCEIDPGLAVPAAELNRLRRDALDQLAEIRAKREPVPFAECAPAAPVCHRAGPLRLRARFRSDVLPEAAKRCELTYLPLTTDPHRLEQLLQSGFPIAVELPRGLFGMESAVRRRLELAKSAGVSDVWAGNLDGAQIALDAGLTVHGGFSLNITNTEALEWYRELGLADAELSFELTLAQAAHIGGELPRGLFLYGRLPLMLCRNCPAANSGKPCSACRGQELTDRRGIRFPVQCYGACSEVLNSVPLSLADRLRDVRGMDFGLLRFSTEQPQEAGQILESYFAALSGTPVHMPEGTYTRGLYYRGFEGDLKKAVSLERANEYLPDERS